MSNKTRDNKTKRANIIALVASLHLPKRSPPAGGAKRQIKIDL